ncbi:hypothetical protein Scep_009300 [Stephania cephalantha]|uniref:CID domain-containing protein n=1 Tax=Stephania cephalantha TaxID=152367 RepID=A0AAP0JTI1_9MAGN
MDKSTEVGRTKMDMEIPNSRFECASVSADQSESHSLVDVFSAAVGDDQRVFEQRVDNVSSLDLLREATLIAGECLRQGSKEAHFQNCILRRIGPVKRSRTALRADSISGSQLNGRGNVGSNGFPVASLDESTYNRKRSSKPFGRSTYFAVESSSCSPVFISNGSSEDNASEAEAANSDSINLTEGSTLESCCKTEQADLSAEYCDRGVPLSEDLHVGVKSVVLKKRRKQKRKQLAHDTPTVGGPDKDHALEVADNKTMTNLPNNCEVLREHVFKVNGDEHLPLVKRARVRMGKLQMEENELNNLKQKEGNSLNEAFVNHSESDTLSCGLTNNCLTESTSLNVRGTDGSALPNCSNGSLESEHKFWKTKNYQIRCCSADGEAALPPSKRLHRALEAMSANTSENGHKHTSVQDKELLSSNGHTSSSDQNSSHTAIEQNSSHSTIEQNSSHCTVEQNSSHCTVEQDFSQMVMNEERGDFIQVVNSTPVEDGHVDEVCGSGSFNCLMSPIKVSLDAKQRNQVVDSLTSPKHSVCKHDFVDQNNDSSLDTLNEKTEIDVDSHISSSSHEMQDGPESCSDPANPSSPSIEENGFPNGSLKDEHGHVLEDTIFMERKNRISSPILSSDPAAESKEGKMSPINDVIEVLPSPSGGSFSRAELPQLDEEADGMCGSVKEIQPKSAWKDIATHPYAPSNENSIAAAQAQRDLSSSCDLDNNLLAIKVSVLSPSVSGGMKCDEKISNLTSTDPSDDNRNDLGDQSETVDASLHQVHENGSGNIESFVSHRQNKWSKAEANAVKKSFQSMLGSLSRTKESIGRATRLALDCARYGIAGEVVEILARYLESEPSLHRRVDLFFLVDSITQCSRSQKVLQWNQGRYFVRLSKQCFLVYYPQLLLLEVQHVKIVGNVSRF